MTTSADLSVSNLSRMAFDCPNLKLIEIKYKIHELVYTKSQQTNSILGFMQRCVRQQELLWYP
jgi:hypothetical protein